MVTKYVTDPLKYFCGFCERFVRRERESGCLTAVKRYHYFRVNMSV